MKTVRQALIMWVSLLCFWAAASAQDAVSSDVLIKQGRRYDGATIAFEGEVIGDIMIRGSHSWVHVSDGQAGIGVWMPAHLAKLIRHAGRYNVRGDRVRVEGVFHRSCPEHGGDLDLHAGSLHILAEGETIARKADREKLALAGVLFLCLCLTWILTRLKHN